MTHREAPLSQTTSCTLTAQERTGDFRALRAKFQNDSNFSSTLLQSAKKPPAEIILWQNTDSSSTPCPKPKPMRRMQVPDPERKTEQFSYTLQKPETAHVKPVVLPRMRLRELSEVGKNGGRKSPDIPGTLCGETASVVDSQRQRPVSCLHPEEAALARNSFHDTLQIWESASTLSDQKCSATPPQPANRTTSLAQARTANVAAATEEKSKMAEKEPSLVLSAPKTPSHFHSEPSPFLLATPPIPPRGQTSLERGSHRAIHVSAFSPNGYDFNKSSRTSQCTNGMEGVHDDEEIKLPKPKPLPSIISLGPPPKKPPRPPKVDLGTFQWNLPDAVDDAYMTPEITETEGLNTYEDTISYLRQPESSMNSARELTHRFKSGTKEDTKKQNFLIATPSAEKEDKKLRSAVWNHELPTQQQAKEIVKISGHGGLLTKPKTNGEHRDEKYVPQEETTQSFPGTGLEKYGNFSDGYVCLETLKTDEEEASLGPRAAKSVQPVEEMYDDVEGLQREFQASETYSSFTLDHFSDDTYEETYEDVQSEGYNSAKSDDVKVEKLKGLGKFFKKGKYKMKNAHLKENFRNLSRSVPNLDVMAQENMMYDEVDTEPNDTNFSSRNFFKVKKYNLEKINKMTKEEKLFREKFMYKKEITVINTAVTHCSNTLTKGKLDLKITAGEQLDVIDITEGNQLICRNSEGKYGYVLLEHLNFRYVLHNVF
ncbi:FYN-binding protein 2 isoform X2 [Elgaria multicarinata webbii]|uniref:FYN-binding protein 2 isoform X2 n=1 Tax=Elgaria multicarinata webbii TaxID=159646 RepID=UPI002FCCC1AD